MAYQPFKPRPANVMIPKAKLLVLSALTLFSAGPAQAQELGAWTLGQAKAANGAVIHLASLTSSTLITSAATDYAALYSISCQTGEPMKWTQQLRLEDSLSSRGQIELIATIDRKLPREEFWIVTDNKRLLTRENLPDIAELRTAKTLKLEWNWGWSWLWLSDEAHFELGDAEAVIFTLAKSCGIEEP
ncbi:MAG: hypothetical protein ABI705_15480 [Aestuariivirga sp.]